MYERSSSEMEDRDVEVKNQQKLHTDFKPKENLDKNMSLEEVLMWLPAFEAYFDWNKSTLSNQTYAIK